METMSIKALAAKALRGNQQGNHEETGSFHEDNTGKPDSFQVSLTKEETRKPYTIIYSRLLDDFLLLVNTDEQSEALRRQGVEDVIYTGSEVQNLRGKTQDEIRAFHKVKKAFPSGRVTRSGKQGS